MVDLLYIGLITDLNNTEGDKLNITNKSVSIANKTEFIIESKSV